MITRIELTNFMSHEHTVIEPAAGLTVLVGPNNCGKSAVVAALQILCSNENSTYVMRHGTRECSVRVQTGDGHVIEWRRKNSPSYIIDGKKFDRLRGSGLPDELHAALRLPKVEAGDETDFDVHFGTQKSPIFLLNGSAATSARFFASSSDAIRLVEMQRRHKEKFGSAQREKNRLEVESKAVNAALGVLEPVVDLEKRLAAAGDAYDEVLRLASCILQAEKSALALRDQSAILWRHSAEVGTLRKLSRPPEIVPTDAMQNLLAELLSAGRETANAESRARALSKLPSPPEVAPIGPLQGLIEVIIAAKARLQSATARADAVQSLRQPPSLAPTEPLQSLIRAMDFEEGWQKTVQSQTHVLSELKSPPELYDVSTLAGLIAEITGIARHQQRTKSESGVLSRISPPPQMDDVGPLSRLAKQLALSADDLALHHRKCSLLARVSAPSQLADESNLAAALAGLRSARRQVAHLEKTAATVAAALPAPSVADTDAIYEVIGRLEQGAVQVGNCESAQQTAESRLAETADALRSTVEGRLCPICGNPLDADRVIERAATGLGGHEHV